MAVFATILQIILVLVSILLVGVILLQRNKGAGAGVTFGGAGDVFGAEMGNVLTKATIVLGSLFLAIVVALSVITSRTHKGSSGSIMEKVKAPAVANEILPEATPEAVEVTPDVVPATVAEEEAAAEVVVPAADEAAAAAEEVAPPVAQ